MSVLERFLCHLFICENIVMEYMPISGAINLILKVVKSFSTGEGLCFHCVTIYRRDGFRL